MTTVITKCITALTALKDNKKTNKQNNNPTKIDLANVTALPVKTIVSVCKASVQNRVFMVNISTLGGGGWRCSKLRGKGGKVSF